VRARSSKPPQWPVSRLRRWAAHPSQEPRGTVAGGPESPGHGRLSPGPRRRAGLRCGQGRRTGSHLAHAFGSGPGIASISGPKPTPAPHLATPPPQSITDRIMILRPVGQGDPSRAGRSVGSAGRSVAPTPSDRVTHDGPAGRSVGRSVPPWRAGWSTAARSVGSWTGSCPRGRC